MDRLVRGVFGFCVGVVVVWLLSALVNQTAAKEPAIAGWVVVQGCSAPLGLAVLYDDGHWEGKGLADISDPMKVKIVESGRKPFYIKVCQVSGTEKNL